MTNAGLFFVTIIIGMGVGYLMGYLTGWRHHRERMENWLQNGKVP